MTNKIAGGSSSSSAMDGVSSGISSPQASSARDVEAGGNGGEVVAAGDARVDAWAPSIASSSLAVWDWELDLGAAKLSPCDWGIFVEKIIRIRVLMWRLGNFCEWNNCFWKQGAVCLLPGFFFFFTDSARWKNRRSRDAERWLVAGWWPVPGGLFGFGPQADRAERLMLYYFFLFQRKVYYFFLIRGL